MSASDIIFVVTDRVDTAKAVSAALGDRARTTVQVCPDLTNLAIQLKRTPAPAVIVDIELQPERILGELQAVIANFPETRFIVLSPELKNQWLLRAMEAGARHFLLMEDLPRSLADVYERLRPVGARSQRSGTAITILSAGGGCGSTMLAMNLTAELSLGTSETLLVDLDMNYGSIAGYLGLHSDYGICDVLADGTRIDGHLIRSTAVPYKEGIEVLLSPAALQPSANSMLRHDNLSYFLRECTQTYDFTVLDAPRLPLSAMVDLAAVSTVTLIVFELNVEDIRVAQLIRRGLLERDIAEDAVWVVASRWRKKHDGISMKAIRQALGSGTLITLSNDYRSCSESINYGKPLADVAPRSSLRRDIQRLAHKLEKNWTLRVSLKGAA